MKLYKAFFSVTFLILVLNLFSCRGAERLDASVTTGQGDVIAPQPGDNSMGFRVWANSSPNTTFITHPGTGAITDNFATNCEVNAGDSNKNITCLVEAEELDLYFHGLTLNYNAPSSMCSYLRVSMPYYFNKLPGVGPASAVDNRNGSVIHGGVAAGSTNEACTFKYLNADGTDAENCCTGSYTLTTWASGASGDTSTVSTVKWGGSPSQCLAGPAKKVMPQTNDGYPMKEVFYVEGVGRLAQYVMPSPISLGLPSNIFLANYFVPADHPVTVGIPLAYAVVSDYPAIIPTRSYVFECLDRDEDYIAQITLSVREWNRNADFLTGATADPDTGGFEPVTGGTINDRSDLKDLGNAYPSEKEGF